jgi:hypothetical protein
MIVVEKKMMQVGVWHPWQAGVRVLLARARAVVQVCSGDPFFSRVPSISNACAGTFFLADELMD